MTKNITNIEPNLADYDKTRANFSWEDWHREFYFYNHGNRVNYAYEVTNHQVEKGNGGVAAIIEQRADGSIDRITYRGLARATDVIAGNLKSLGLKPGERFAIYAPRSIDYAKVLLASVKCGAVAVPLFDAFGPGAIKDRINDCSASWIYVAGDLFNNVRLGELPSLKKVLMNRLPAGLEKTKSDVRFVTLAELMRGKVGWDAVSFGDLETAFIIHYTSGSTAKPKGVLLANRTMVGHLVTGLYVLDLRRGDRLWNTGDPGWITGMVYNFFAPLLLGATTHIYHGPFHPQGWSNFMRKMKITVWYSTPTAFRLLRYYNAPVNRKNTPCLRHIVSAGEPLNSSLVDWTMENLGIPIHDSWYMTENGHQLINNYRCLTVKKGSMGKPFPGIEAAIIDEKCRKLPVGKVGRLAVKTPWPGLMKTIWNNRKKFDSYFEKGWYISGDMAYRDRDGYFWFQGREDDMIKSAAERISPFEIENILVSHPAVGEAAVIEKPDDLYGGIVKAFVVLKPNFASSESVREDIVRHVRDNLSTSQVPREVEFVGDLPKTRSGKIMRRLLRAKEMNMDLGDVSTLDTEMKTDLK